MRTTSPALLAAAPALALSCAAAAVPPSWSTFSTGPNAAVNTLNVCDLGQGPRLLFGGAFTAGAGIPSSYVASWNGAAFDAMPSLNGEVKGLTMWWPGASPRLIACGSVGLVGGPNPLGGDGTNVVALGPAGWAKLTPNCQIPWVGGVGTFNGDLIATGGGMGYIQRFTGTQWLDLGAGLITVSADMLTIQEPGGQVLITTAGPASTPGLSMMGKWNGTSWTAIASSANGINNFPEAVCMFDDGAGSGPALFAGGPFGGSFPGVANHIAKLSGAAWLPLGLGVNGTVRAMTVFDDGGGEGPALYAAGDFTTAGGQPANRIARWKNGQWSPLGEGIAGGSVYALAVFDDDGPGPIPPALYAAGSFTSAGGQPAARWARWGRPAPCAADIASSGGSLGGDGQLSVDDVVVYLQSFFDGHTAVADLASLGGAPTPDGVLTVDDLVAYLAAFFAGCP